MVDSLLTVHRVICQDHLIITDVLWRDNIMTEFKSYPTLNVAYGRMARTQGLMNLVFRGDGSVGAMTEGGNRVTFRGQEYSIHLEFARQADGTFAETGRYPSIKRAEGWTDAPPTFAARITSETAALIAEAWNPTVDRLGLEASVAQDLHRLERKAAELIDELAKISTEIAAAQARLA